MRAAGNGLIAESLPVPIGDTYRLISVSCVFAITLTMNSVGGSQYDVLLYTVDPSTLAATDILWQPDEEYFLIGGDAIDAAYAGTDGYGWAIEWTVKAVP
jgi:hypothetical protein